MMQINVKMPTIVGILTFMSMINVMLSWVEQAKSFIISYPGHNNLHTCTLLKDVMNGTIKWYPGVLTLLSKAPPCKKAVREISGKYSKILNTFLILFSNKMMVIHKMLVRRANREDL